MLKSWIVLIALSVSLVGCAGWQPSKHLPFPVGPTLIFTQVDGRSCITRKDANALATYFDQLEAFKHAYER